jgi:serine/threonine protein kinase
MDRPVDGLPEQYTIVRQIGAGGMATVYLARDAKHNREVALKLLHSELSSSLGADRFLREIQLAARLQHPHILPVFDSGESAGKLWYTMPYVHGESLRDRLSREKQLPIGEAVRIATETARALADAHAEGVIHRDIKPENLLLAKDGSTLVADFGIARVADGVEPGLTATGITLGTPAYMSPEQATGEREIDARSDIYALGAVLYEMLAGEPAFGGPNAHAVIARLLTQTPRAISAIRPAVSVAVDGVIAKAMARSPGDRYATMDAFATALGAAAGAPAIEERAGIGSNRQSRPRRTAAIAAVVVVGALLLSALATNRSRLLHPSASASNAGAAGATSLAVLPFENRGSVADVHIADGIADEIRGKLAGLPGLVVIARASSDEYRGTVKRPQQIASELGVTYLLGGTVQYEPAADSRPARLRVSPELVQVAKDAAGSYTRRI